MKGQCGLPVKILSFDPQSTGFLAIRIRALYLAPPLDIKSVRALLNWGQSIAGLSMDLMVVPSVYLLSWSTWVNSEPWCKRAFELLSQNMNRFYNQLGWVDGLMNSSREGLMNSSREESCLALRELGCNRVPVFQWFIVPFTAVGIGSEGQSGSFSRCMRMDFRYKLCNTWSSDTNWAALSWCLGSYDWFVVCLWMGIGHLPVMKVFFTLGHP